MLIKKLPLITFVLFAASSFFSQSLSAATLNIDTDYRIRSINYTNNDFNTKTSSDTLAYYSQRLQLSISGKFTQDIEIGSKLTALGIAGSTTTIFPVPYPRTDFTPYVETAYIKVARLAELPLDIIIGKQNIVYGDGFIISDNGTGMNAFRFMGYGEKPLPWQAELMFAKLKDNLRPASDQDIIGLLAGVSWKKHLWQVSFFQEDDFSGTIYRQGSQESQTSSIVKQFYDIRIERKEKDLIYSLEIAKQGGYIVKTSSGFARPQTNLNGLGYTLSGELIGEKTKLGKVAAHALLAVSTGDDNTLSLDDDDESFTPTLTRRFDGLERKGYGELFSATPLDAFFSIPESFSGINTLNVGANFSPVYAVTLGVDYFLYSASQGPPGSPGTSGFEKIFGAEFTLGIELDLSVKYVYSKYFETRFSYNRYTPPKFETYWPSSEPATRYQFEVLAKF